MPSRPKINPLNTAIGVVGIAYLLIFCRYFILSSGREHFGNAVISLLALGTSLLPALGCLLGLWLPERSFTVWRALALVVCGLLIWPLMVLWSYEH